MRTTLDVTITVTDVEEPPRSPNGLTVNWTEPTASGGLPSGNYYLRYFASASSRS
ncbi:MAG: hypothetical protein OXN89_00025 [Bryobacterales bacterium]|nr:hypothetical protein [Bryobacterales bacterium]